jgi:flagellar export protein FliJ
VSVSGFRFRAQAALDLRRREDDEALGAVARAEAGLRVAQTVLSEREQGAAEARARWAVAVQEPDSASQRLWYQSWIVRLDRERAVAAGIVAARRTEQARTTALRAETHRRVEALVKFRQKAVRAWEQRIAAQEQKLLDALATMRFVTATRARANG